MRLAPLGLGAPQEHHRQGLRHLLAAEPDLLSLRNPLDRLTARLPRPWRIAIDWIVTIAAAVGIVLAIKTWVVNPYRIPSASMEPTLHCAHSSPTDGCEARFSDRVLANRFIYRFRKPHRGEIVVFDTPSRVRKLCGTGGTFVKRLIGLPGETVYEDEKGFLWIDGKKLDEPYLRPARRDRDTEFRDETWHVTNGGYFFVGDNRGQSCDSRRWGNVPRKDLIGPVFATYWPPGRITLRTMLPTTPFLSLLLVWPLRRRRRSG